jgi:hypothetical protein
MIGRVVWAHESGPHVGEFGIRFTHLSDRDQTRIEALIQRWGRPTAKAPLVQLQLDGVGSPIVAEVHSETEGALCVEQPLPFLAIGASVLNESSGRRGHLEAVELKIDEITPRLVLSIGYEVEEASADSAAGEGDRDTLPDEAPLQIRVQQGSHEERMHDTPRIVCYRGSRQRTTPRAIERLFEVCDRTAFEQRRKRPLRAARSAGPARYEQCEGARRTDGTIRRCPSLAARRQASTQAGP